MTPDSRLLTVLAAFALLIAIPVSAMEIYVETATAGKERFKRGTLERYADDELEFHLDGGGKLTLRQGNIRRVAFGVKPEWWLKGKKKNGEIRKRAAAKTPGKTEAKRPPQPKKIDRKPPKSKTQAPRDGSPPNRARRGKLDEIARRFGDLTRLVREHLDAHPEKKRDIEGLRQELVKQSDPKLANLLVLQLVGKLQSIPMGRGRKVPLGVVGNWMRREIVPNMEHQAARDQVIRYLRTKFPGFDRRGKRPARRSGDRLFGGRREMMRNDGE